MSLAIDIILVAIVAINVISGWRKGFAVTLLKSFSFVAAAVISYFICGLIGDTMIEKVIVFVIALLAVVFIIQIITPVINKIFKLPVLHFTNKVLGIVLGLVIGLALVWMWACILGVVIPMLSGLFPEVFPANTIENTVILSKLTQYNPLGLFNIF